MNKYINTDISQHIMRLIQLGARVQVISGKVVYVQYLLENNIQVAYIYHINKNNKYFLERIKPYPLPLYEYETATDVINTIEKDIKEYTNALKSKNIHKFIDINRTLHNTIKSFEELFLHYNIPAELIDKITTDLTDINNIINNAANDSNKVIIDKDE